MYSDEKCECNLNVNKESKVIRVTIDHTINKTIFVNIDCKIVEHSRRIK